MACTLIVICPRRVAAPMTEVANALGAAARLDWQLHVCPRVGAAADGMGSR
jgi:hypothetical protein